MKKFYEKYELLFSILLIIIYLVVNSICVNTFGMTDIRTSIINILLSIIILIFIFMNRLSNYYGLSSFPKVKRYLYYIPLIMMVSVNLWNGINIENTTSEIIYYIISMIGVGFLEEIIFRGFLFKAMEKDSVKAAVIVTSLTFGVGHIINLLNGAEFIPTLLQVIYATSTGYLFVTIFQKSKSLWPCIITHILVNSLSIFNNSQNIVNLYIAPIFLTIVPLLYTFYIKKNIK